MKSDIALVIVSYDKSSFLWNTIFESLSKYWPDCPYDKYLIVNFSHQKFDNVVTINVGEDKGWSSNLIIALNQIKNRYCLILIDDLFFISKVNQKKIDEIIEEAKTLKFNCLKLNPISENYPTKIINKKSEKISKIPKNTPYRVSTVLTLWKKEILFNILKEGETAWDFEVQGSKRSNDIDNFLSCRDNSFNITNLLLRGKIRQISENKMNKAGIFLQKHNRKYMSMIDITFWFLKERLSRIFYLLPISFQNFIK